MKSGQLWIVQLAEGLSRRVSKQIGRWDDASRKHPGDQWQRATDSIGVNITEGYGRYHTNDSFRFYSYAQGSVEESLFWLRRAFDRKLISRLECATFTTLIIRIGRSLDNFVRARSNSPVNVPK